MTAAPSYPVLTRMKNPNNVLINEYFGQLETYQHNWWEYVGNRYIVEHKEVGIPLLVELKGVIVEEVAELKQMLDVVNFTDFMPPFTLRELLGMDEHDIDRWKINTMHKSNAIGIYIFKNVNY